VIKGGTSGVTPEATAGRVTKKKPNPLERSLTLNRWRPADNGGTVNKVENLPLRSARTVETLSPPNLTRSRRFDGKWEPLNRTVSPIGAAVGVQRTRLPLREAISPIDGRPGNSKPVDNPSALTSGGNHSSGLSDAAEP
jgi:hypothetical protein